MKILHVSPSYLPAYTFGGSVKAVHELCRGLAGNDMDVSVYTTDIGLEENKIQLCAPQNIDGVKVTYFPISFPRSYCYSRQFTEAVIKNIKRFDIVHIHSVYRYTTFITARLCKKYGKPYLLNPFGALDQSMIKLKSSIKKAIYISIVEKSNIKNAKAVHVASEYEREALLSMGFDNPTVIIPPSLSLEDYLNDHGSVSLREKYPDLLNKKIILFLGRIHPKKGLDTLAEAFKKICDKRNDVYLVIAGTGEESYVNLVKSNFKKPGIGNRVIFTGMLLGRDKSFAFYTSDLFILPSYGENFGIAALEAMACGLPVIVTNKVGLFPDIKEYGSGIVTTCNAGQVAEAILKLLDNEALRKTMGQSGRKLVEDRFTNDRIADKVVNIYREVLKK
ncbi:MAG: glycosyltransferase [Candidatus Omnitrophica bacterium]|nr:glycosyltransferase [Candidatus Omnitrophota bacterium]